VNPTTAYRKIHKTLRVTRGAASQHTCPCGKRALDWAYQFTAGDQELRLPDGSHPHSANPDDYVAMCRRCHMSFDLEHDPAMADQFRLRGMNASTKTNTMRRRCLECGYISTPGGVGAHQYMTGHTGFDRITAEPEGEEEDE